MSVDLSRFAIGEWYTHAVHGRVKLIRAYPEVGCFYAKPEHKAARMIQAVNLTLPPESVRERDCYRPFEVRMKFGRKDDQGRFVPLSRITLIRWRKAGTLPFIQPNSRVVLYPKSAVDALVKLRGEVKQA
jgi:hypothetical protein